jgi:hypothetical protein
MTMTPTPPATWLAPWEPTPEMIEAGHGVSLSTPGWDVAKYRAMRDAWLSSEQYAAMREASPVQEPVAERSVIFDRFGVLLGSVRDYLNADAQDYHERGLDSTAQSLGGMAHGLGDLLQHLLGHREAAAPVEPASQPREPLSDEQIEQVGHESIAPWVTIKRDSDLYKFARAIERAHGIGSPGATQT